MKKVLPILGALVLSLLEADGQNKINFTNKIISDLDVSMGYKFGPGGLSILNMPNIWNDLDFPRKEAYVFSGYYTLNKKSDDVDKELDGEVQLIRFQIGEGTGATNIKEELTFNYSHGDISGPIRYFQYSSEWDKESEVDETYLKNAIWTKDISISAVYNQDRGRYENINYSGTRAWEKTNYTITQSSSSDISLNYFNTIIDLNSLAPTEKPIFKKMKID